MVQGHSKLINQAQLSMQCAHDPTSWILALSCRGIPPKQMKDFYLRDSSEEGRTAETPARRRKMRRGRRGISVLPLVRFLVTISLWGWSSRKSEGIGNHRLEAIDAFVIVSPVRKGGRIVSSAPLLLREDLDNRSNRCRATDAFTTKQLRRMGQSLVIQMASRSGRSFEQNDDEGDSDDDDDDDDELIDVDSLGDWRTFRRNLSQGAFSTLAASNSSFDGGDGSNSLSSSIIETAGGINTNQTQHSQIQVPSASSVNRKNNKTNISVSPENQEVLETQSKELADEYRRGVWAHETSVVRNSSRNEKCWHFSHRLRRIKFSQTIKILTRLNSDLIAKLLVFDVLVSYDKPARGGWVDGSNALGGGIIS